VSKLCNGIDAINVVLLSHFEVLEARSWMWRSHSTEGQRSRSGWVSFRTFCTGTYTSRKERLTIRDEKEAAGNTCAAEWSEYYQLSIWALTMRCNDLVKSRLRLGSGKDRRHLYVSTYTHVQWETPVEVGIELLNPLCQD